MNYLDMNPRDVERDGGPSHPPDERVADMWRDPAECARYIREVGPELGNDLLGALLANGVTWCVASAEWRDRLNDLRECVAEWCAMEVMS